MNITDKTLEHVFSHHAPTVPQQDIYIRLRTAAKAYAKTLLDYCPESRERYLALTSLQDASMWANAAVAINESNPEQ